MPHQFRRIQSRFVRTTTCASALMGVGHLLVGAQQFPRVLPPLLAGGERFQFLSTRFTLIEVPRDVGGNRFRQLPIQQFLESRHRSSALGSNHDRRVPSMVVVKVVFREAKGCETAKLY